MEPILCPLVFKMNFGWPGRISLIALELEKWQKMSKNAAFLHFSDFFPRTVGGWLEQFISYGDCWCQKDAFQLILISITIIISFWNTINVAFLIMPSLIRPFSNGSSDSNRRGFDFLLHKLSWVIKSVPRKLLQKKMMYFLN